jgi:endo-1,4-beta-xylanase
MIIKRTFRAVVALIAFVTTAVWVAPTPAMAAYGDWIVRSYLDVNKCIDDPSGSPTQDLQMTIFYCVGSLGQNWTMDPSAQYPSATHSWFRNGASNKCLTVFGARTVSNTAVVQHSCTDGNNEVWNQVFTGINDSWGRDYYTLHPLNASGQCLTVFGGSTANGTKLITYTCNGGSNQMWTWNKSPN